jgi:hypothetical protein
MMPSSCGRGFLHLANVRWNATHAPASSTGLEPRRVTSPKTVTNTAAKLTVGPLITRRQGGDQRRVTAQGVHKRSLPGSRAECPASYICAYLSACGRMTLTPEPILRASWQQHTPHKWPILRTPSLPIWDLQIHTYLVYIMLQVVLYNIQNPCLAL